MLKMISAAAIAAVSMTIASAADAGTVKIVSNGYNPAILNNFYNSYGGHTSTIGSGPINTLDLTGVNLLWLIQPTSAYTGAEISAMSSYLASGGRIAFMGEHGFFAPQQNLNINGALSGLGANMTIVNAILDPGFRTATVANGQILSNPLTAGVNAYEYAAFAPVTISGSAQALMVGADQTSVMMAYQNIGGGSIFLITDQNVWDNAASLWPNHDNEVMFDNLVAATTGGGVPEPATWALMILGFGAVGGALRRRQSVKTTVRFA